MSSTDKKGLEWKFLSFMLAVIMVFCMFPSKALASAGQKKAWIRAKVDYEYDKGIEGLNDSILVFSNDKWTKDDDEWYYYADSVKSGDKIRFIDAIQIPHEWTNDIINKKFKVVVTVEVCEAVRGDIGYVKNRPSSYSVSYELWSLGYSDNDGLDISKSSRMTIEIHEYQLDRHGDEVEYRNNKTIVPGQEVSKIVEFQLNELSFAENIATGDISELFVLIAVAAVVISAFVLLCAVLRVTKRKFLILKSCKRLWNVITGIG